jgi:hypothetical protein
MTNTPVYRVWQAMVSRCTLERSKFFYRYGGRGIKVCDRWRDFKNFYEDMGDRPSPSHSIDRVNNDGNYEPGNCRWATRAEQDLNNSRNVHLTHEGKTMTMKEWAIAKGIRYGTLVTRVARGWSDDRALETPVATRGPG